MAATNQASTDNAFAPQEYSRSYIIQMRFLANMEKGSDAHKDWLLMADVRCHDLLHVMRHGLFWTTSNIVPELGYRAREEKSLRPIKRVWELREHPDRPESQSRWTITFTLYAHSSNTLADFRLGALRQEMIWTASAWNTMAPPEIVFQYYHPNWPDPDKTLGNINCWVDELHPQYGSWWFFPMETVPDYGTIDAEGTTVTEKGSLI